MQTSGACFSVMEKGFGIFGWLLFLFCLLNFVFELWGKKYLEKKIDANAFCFFEWYYNLNLRECLVEICYF